MSNRSIRPQKALDDRGSPRLRIDSHDDVEALVLQAVASVVVEIAQDDCEQKLARLFTEAGFQTLSYERPAPRLHLL